MMVLFGADFFLFAFILSLADCLLIKSHFLSVQKRKSNIKLVLSEMKLKLKSKFCLDFVAILLIKFFFKLF